MGYSRTTWNTGDIIEAEKLNNIETGLETASGAAETNTAGIAALTERLAQADAMLDAIGRALAGDGVCIAKSPVDVESATGVSVTLSVSVYPADATGVTYKWQNRSLTAAGAQWTDSTLTGFNTAAMTVPVTDARYNYEWRCLVTHNGITLASRGARILRPAEAGTRLQKPAETGDSTE